MDNKLFVKNLLEKAKKRYDDAEVYFQGSTSSAISLYNGNLEEFNITDSNGAQLLVRRGLKWGRAYTEDISEDSIDYLLDKVEAGLEVAEDAPEQMVYKAEADEKLIEKAPVKAFEFQADQVLDTLNQLNQTINQQAQKMGEEVRMASVSISYNSVENIIANTQGLEREDQGALATLVAYVVLARGDEMKSGFDFQVISDLADVDLEGLAKKALTKAVETYGAKSMASGKYRVVMENDTFSSLVSAALGGAFSAEMVQKGMSLLQGKEGQAIASEKLTMYDFPASEHNPVPSSFDGEGVPTQKLALVEKGKLSNYLHSLETAKKADAQPTGNASRSYKSASSPSLSFLYVEPGEKDFDGLLAEVGDGILITGLQGLHSGLNPISGDYSLPADGFLIKDGKKDRPVNQITIAGNIIDTLKRISEVGSDSKLTMNVNYVPSVIIDDIPVSGELEE